MAHKVKFSIPERELGRADIEFKVRRNAAMFGRLKVSKGAIVWVPKGKGRGYKIRWSLFDQTAKEIGKRE
jgi:hypothetical protein